MFVCVCVCVWFLPNTQNDNKIENTPSGAGGIQQ